MQLAWDKSLEVGVTQIDNQHRELFKRTDDFLEAMKKGKGKDEVAGTLKFLEEYVVKHFHDEEELQKRYNYPKMAIQVEQHERFKAKISELRSRYEQNNRSIMTTIDMQKFMSEWWRTHITTLDKDLGMFLQGKL